MIGAPFLILNAEVKLLQVCGPLLIVVILHFSLYLHELQTPMIHVDDCLPPYNVMLPLATGLYDGIHFFVISGVLTDYIRECLTMIGHCMTVLSENITNSISESIDLNIKWLL
jgi:hypothetical protein